MQNRYKWYFRLSDCDPYVKVNQRQLKDRFGKSAINDLARCARGHCESQVDSVYYDKGYGKCEGFTAEIGANQYVYVTAESKPPARRTDNLLSCGGAVVANRKPKKAYREKNKNKDAV